jgi:hypothetical protein
LCSATNGAHLTPQADEQQRDLRKADPGAMRGSPGGTAKISSYFKLLFLNTEAVV